MDLGPVAAHVAAAAADDVAIVAFAGAAVGSSSRHALIALFAVPVVVVEQAVPGGPGEPDGPVGFGGPVELVEHVAAAEPLVPLAPFGVAAFAACGFPQAAISPAPGDKPASSSSPPGWL